MVIRVRRQPLFARGRCSVVSIIFHFISDRMRAHNCAGGKLEHTAIHINCIRFGGECVTDLPCRERDVIDCDKGLWCTMCMLIRIYQVISVVGWVWRTTMKRFVAARPMICVCVWLVGNASGNVCCRQKPDHPCLVISSSCYCCCFYFLHSSASNFIWFRRATNTHPNLFINSQRFELITI